MFTRSMAWGWADRRVRRPLRELLDDRLLDALLERSRDQAGGLRLTGEGSIARRAGAGGLCAFLPCFRSFCLCFR